MADTLNPDQQLALIRQQQNALANAGVLKNLKSQSLLSPGLLSNSIPTVGGTPRGQATVAGSPNPQGIEKLVSPAQAKSGVGQKLYQADIPQVQAPSGTALHGQQEEDRLEYQNAHPWGSTVSTHPGLGGKLLHGLATAGNIAGDVFLPNVMARIPGTQLNKEVQRGENNADIKQGAENELKTAQTGEQNALAEGNELTDYTLPNGTVIQAPAKSHGALDEQFGKTAQTGANTEARIGSQEKIAGENNATKVETAQIGANVKANAPQKQNDFEQFYSKYLEDNNLPDSARNRTMARKEWATASAPPGTIAPTFDPQGNIVGAWNNKSGPQQLTPPQQANVTGTTAAGNTLHNKEDEAFNKDYVNPANQVDKSYRLYKEAEDAFNRGDLKTGAASMLMLSQHLGTTFGSIKGSRQTRDLINEHRDAIGIMDRIERYSQMLATGQQLAPDQVKEFGDQITNLRNLTWQMDAKEAARRHIPLDFLPGDAMINVADDHGVVRPVPGNKVQGYLDKGARLGD